MFKINEIASVLNSPGFNQDFNWVRQSLLSHRFHQGITPHNGEISRLNYFVESVLASVPYWDTDESIDVCRITAEIAELLSNYEGLTEWSQRRMRVHSALLYEFAELPALAAAILENRDFSGILIDLFERRGVFGHLSINGELKTLRSDVKLRDATELDRALSFDAIQLAEYEQGVSNLPQQLISESLVDLAKQVSIGMTSAELHAFASVVSKRSTFATRSNVEDELYQTLRELKFPAELWSTQVRAIQEGLINSKFDSWGFAAPTGTGKTFLAGLLITKTLLDDSDAQILYIVPSKALVYEVWSKLDTLLKPLEYKVVRISPQLVELDDEENSELINCSVAVLTPEKADMLLRLGYDFIHNASLIVVDEAHHIESGSRGILLELYLWRIKRLFKYQSRIIFLSAVTPNINELAEWIGNNPGGVTIDRRSTRMRAGVYRIRKIDGKKQGWIDYSDRTTIQVFDSEIESSTQRQLIQLTERMGNAGPVLVVAKGKRRCETLARKTADWLVENKRLKQLSKNERGSECIQRLDSRLEREMYVSVEMRKLIKNRIVYHHAGLPPRVRTAVEDAIREGFVDFVFATTTLAEGVNFPFSTVIVESLALKDPPEKGKPAHYHPVTPRSFWNIAGRAGRPGYDREGQAILFEPSLGLDKINAVLEDYLDPSLLGVEPVRSALAGSIKEIIKGVKQNEYNMEAFESVVLPEQIPRTIKGTINLLRVGLIHAKASELLETPESILESTFAIRYLDESEKETAFRLISSQAKVVDDFLGNFDEPPIDMIAELGLSIETLSELRDYVLSLDDWQLENMQKVMYGGQINFDQVQYIIGPVAKRMAELEGPKLGGFYSEVIIHWLSGIPLTNVRAKAEFKSRLEDLITIIYSRIQFLLPWGLYAVHRLIEEETKKRGVSYNASILSLAYLVDAGVPNFDALRLVNLEFERVDATRLANEYQKRSKPFLDTDVIGWLAHENKNTILKCLQGTDKRRIDYDLPKLLEALSS